ncbi:hypothetical protein GCM10027406_26870 [Leifsonia lichenia]
MSAGIPVGKLDASSIVMGWWFFLFTDTGERVRAQRRVLWSELGPGRNPAGAHSGREGGITAGHWPDTRITARVVEAI